MKEIQILNNGDTLNAIRTKINENFELMEQGVGADPLTKFGVNEGNETNGVADLLDINEGTLNFKVGGEYPNLVMTSGDGTTTKIENVNPLYLQNLLDGEYTVVVDGSNSNITDATFYSQLLEPENPNAGDVWFNGENATQLNSVSPTLEKRVTPQISEMKCMARNGENIVVAGGGNYVHISTDGGNTWESKSIVSGVLNFTFVGATVVEDTFLLIGQNGTVYYSQDLETWQSVGTATILGGSQITRLKLVGRNLIGFTGGRSIIYSSTKGTNWASAIIGDGTMGGVRDIVEKDGTFYAVNATGQLFSGANFTTWTTIGKKYENVSCASFYNEKLLVGTTDGNLYIDDLTGEPVTTKTVKSDSQIKTIYITEDNYVLIAGTAGLCSVTKDLENFEQIYTGTETVNAVHNEFIITPTNLFKISLQEQWVPYPYIPVGELTISGGQVTYFTTYPYNSNGLFDATSSSYGLLRTAAEPDELNCQCSDAVLTPANLYNLQNFRLGGTEYNVDDKVACPYHHNLQLVCTQAGTTSNEALNTREILGSGDVIEDGSVVWKVEELGSGGGTGLNDKITNCLTEIPQRIKLELADGILILKAGSEVIVPNGFEEDGTTPKFDYVTIKEDIVRNAVGFANSNSSLVFFSPDTNIIFDRSEEICFSGTTTPTGSYATWYDSNTNTIKNTNTSGSTWTSGYSLPFALVKSNDNSFASIEQTFNALGYMGSSFWINKDVKVLLRNGKNEDGTYKNIELVIPKIQMKRTTLTSAIGHKLTVHTDLGSGIFDGWWDGRVFEQVEEPTIWSYGGSLWINPETNISKYHPDDDNADWVELPSAIIGTGNRLEGGKVGNFKVKQAFRAIDYNDKAAIGSWAMPSNKYIDLTLGASGTTYTAPANGWFFLSMKAKSANSYILIGNSICHATTQSNSTNDDNANIFPCKKGDSIFINYLDGTVTYFRFIYAEGEV